jgi:N-acyl-D-aspartate/D-glutamate deacylase
MPGEHDLIIRNGTIVDGSGRSGYEGDVAVSNGIIVEIGPRLSARGREEIEARGQLVTPGFVDIHTHYDGQVTWEETTEPSSSHGVTTVLTGNCGVGFAPCRAKDRKRLVQLLEGVEDIPGVVMDEGLPWDWETFPQYLDAVERRRHDINIATLLPHACLRVYVMGERGINREDATAEDLARMTELTTQAMRAGALGFGTSRSIAHRDVNGVPIPTKNVLESELEAIAAGMKAVGHGIFQAAFDFADLEQQFHLVRGIAGKFGRPVTFAIGATVACPDAWRKVLRLVDEANREGLNIRPQFSVRPMALLFGLDCSHNPFSLSPTYKKIAHLPLADRVAILRDPEMRARILGEKPDQSGYHLLTFLNMWEWMFRLDDPPNYEPSLEESIAAIARRRGVTPAEVAYDAMLEEDGKALLLATTGNYLDGTLSVAAALLEDPNTLIGLGDGGAHYGIVCDAGYPTFMLTYWTRDRKGARFTVEAVVKAMAHETARLLALNDRGLIRVGYRGDLNVIDYDRLRLHAPRARFDLPAGGRRLTQKATGYTATIVDGAVTYRDGAHTGALPGRLVRGPQSARPSAARAPGSGP